MVHSGSFKFIQVHSELSTTLPITGDLGNREKSKYTWVHSVQPPQPFIILKGGGEAGKMARRTSESLRSGVGNASTNFMSHF